MTLAAVTPTSTAKITGVTNNAPSGVPESPWFDQERLLAIIGHDDPGKSDRSECLLICIHQVRPDRHQVRHRKPLAGVPRGAAAGGIVTRAEGHRRRRRGSPALEQSPPAIVPRRASRCTLLRVISVRASAASSAHIQTSRSTVREILGGPPSLATIRPAMSEGIRQRMVRSRPSSGTATKLGASSGRSTRTIRHAPAEDLAGMNVASRTGRPVLMYTGPSFLAVAPEGFGREGMILEDRVGLGRASAHQQEPTDQAKTCLGVHGRLLGKGGGRVRFRGSGGIPRLPRASAIWSRQAPMASCKAVIGRSGRMPG